VVGVNFLLDRMAVLEDCGWRAKCKKEQKKSVSIIEVDLILVD
jgi:hypothetical protein